MSRRDFGAENHEPPGQGNAPNPWPLHVRILAVSHVLSHAVQWVGFFLLTGTATFLFGIRLRLDGLVLGLGLSGVACVLLCAGFRRWFVRWGRKHYRPAGDGPWVR